MIISDQVADALLVYLAETERLGRLSNKELVAECLRDNETDCPVVDEMCRRLWPEWADEELDGIGEQAN